jgi:deoxyribodipyrimidine photo-lyase
MTTRNLFVFRRDLRLTDNSGLIAAMENATDIIPVFIVDPALVTRWQQSNTRMTFLANALTALDLEIRTHGGKLQILQGDPVEEVEKLIQQNEIHGVFTNRDYTPLSRRRDHKLKRICDRYGVSCHNYGDQLLNEPEAVFKADGSPYTVFTPYFKRAQQLFVAPPESYSSFSFDTVAGSIDLESSLLGSYIKNHVDLNVRDTDEIQDANKALNNLSELTDYDNTKDIPGVRGTARLSALLRFGICSPRQVYQAIKKSHDASHGIIRQLYWRDFYFQIGFHFPHVYHSAFRRKYDHLKWDRNPAGFAAWQQGKTGFPIVDAGMRELEQTGFMHNRVRMVVASFLTKNLHINWREGERHFAKHLLDYDPALNNGNWQWSASTGCDAQPYFRVFNPWRQQKRFDQDCVYIKQWIPELRAMNPSEIHRLEKDGTGYLPQIVDLKSSAVESKQRFKDLA